jgi:hypothetical protein
MKVSTRKRVGKDNFDNQNVDTFVTLKLALFLVYEDVDWIHLAQDRINKWADVEYKNAYSHSINHGGFHDTLRTYKFLTGTNLRHEDSHSFSSSTSHNIR